MLQVSLFAIREFYNASYYWGQLIQSLGRRRASKKLFPLEDLLEPCGLEETLEVLGAVEGYDKAKFIYFCYCARKALPLFEQRYPGNTCLRVAVETAERYARGQAKRRELTAAARPVQSLENNLNKNVGKPWDEDREDRLAIISVIAMVDFCVSCKEFPPQGFHWITNAMYYFVLHAVGRDNLPTYTSPALEAIKDELLTAAGGAAGLMAGDIAKILAEKQLESLSLEDLQEIIRQAIFENTCLFAIEGIQEAARKALEEDLTWEFRRLCRLEGEYGEVAEC